VYISVYKVYMPSQRATGMTGTNSGTCIQHCSEEILLHKMV
jgi:hypothetical protein